MKNFWTDFQGTVDLNNYELDNWVWDKVEKNVEQVFDSYVDGFIASNELVFTAEDTYIYIYLI